MRLPTLLLALLLIAPDAVLGQARATGAAVRLRPAATAPPSARAEIQGELIAARRDSVWVALGDAEVRGWAAGEVGRLRVERHRYGWRFAGTWALAGWAVTSFGMTVACAQVEEGGCVVIVPLLMAVPWGLAWLVGGATLESSRWLRLTPDRLEAAGAYARFPQGLPPPRP